MVILRVFATVLTLVFATTAAAQCFGTDLRPDLTDAERAELTDRVAAMPFNEGNYWTASRGAQLLHVVGTVHLDEPRLDPVMERLAPVVRRATQLYVEATAEEEAKLQSAIATRPELLFLTSGPTLPDMMEEADWQALADAARIRGIPPFMAAKMQPWYLTIMLSMPSCAVEQMAQGIRGLDHRIMEVAAESDVPQQALEPYDTLFQLMGGEPMDRQIEYLNMGTIPNALSEDLLATLMASYFEERPAEVFEVNRLFARRIMDLPDAELDALLDDMLGALLVQRNVAWMDIILAAPAGETVIAVGAAHLPGDKGVLNLLAEAGFTLERQSFF